MEQYLEHFIHHGPAEFSRSCTERLRRTLTNGVRKEVPCWIELHSIEMKTPMNVTVTLMDGHVLTLPLDSSSTSAELCTAIAEEINLLDTFGFSIYISYCDKNWSLGCAGHHVLDDISLCEQEERRKGGVEMEAPWRLCFRKELFTPWHDCTSDPVSTDLIYTQIIHDLKSGEYQCDKEDDYIQLSAKHYYIRYGRESSREQARSIVWESLSLNLIENKSEVKLVQLVSAAHEQGPYINSGTSPDGVKAEVVTYAQLNWPIYFSKFYEATGISGPGLPEEKLVVAVNWYGVSFQEGKERTYLKLAYPEVTGVQLVSDGRMREVVLLSTLRGEYKLMAAKAHSMVELLSMFLSGLKERSIYSVAAYDYSRLDDVTFLSFRKGDLIEIIKDRAFAHEGGWISGRNDRTGQTGAISTDAITVLPTLTRPSDDILALLDPHQRKSVLVVPPKEDANTETVAHSSLKEFSYEHFREAGKEAGRQGKVGVQEKLVFLDAPVPILKYMGDYPVKSTRHPVELTDQIYDPALQHPELRDEVYCQIMKQLTNNYNGLEARTSAPHHVEVEAIRQNSSQIFHKIHFPDETAELFEVTTTTRIRDLCRAIANNLMLSSADGYSLFVKTTHKVVSMNEQLYFFDHLKELTDAPRKGKKTKDATPNTIPYLVLFMRKLWFNVIPGKDLKADLMFHFPQELPKYLRGYHSIEKKDLIPLAGLLFRVRVDADRSQFVMIPRMLKELVPADQLKIMSAEEWKKHIISEYNKQAGITVEEAKVRFLKLISSWPTFGCAFFSFQVKGYKMDDLLSSYVQMYLQERKVVGHENQHFF
ncbi:Unconventional myosin-VIIb [Bagarius yarrelli]|uniref:Unconventional myosin-VIIb n=1 Tax=Bagarius yarrelli TaxID=175774 RepID=A0A556TRN8_BAGYA|nr:Unconventional myosin-VIIb [Bagarius yarrelli]